MRPAQTIVLAALIGLSGCAGSIFYYEPMVDTRKDDQGNIILRDTPRMWADWTRAVDMAVAKEAAGDAVRGGMPSWEAHWQRVIRENSTGRENPQKYIDYLLDARRRVGLPELEGPQVVSDSVSNDTCALVHGIQSLPFRAEQRGIDGRYDTLMGVDVTTRQVAECIGDTTPMSDPRQSPNRVNAFVVGDAAYIVFTRKSGIAFESLLPSDVSATMGVKGANAYFEWVAQPGKRAELAARAVASANN